MSLAKTVNTTTASCARASRRSLMGGAALAFTAAASAVGITAGFAASVADLVPGEPDADLVRICGEFVALELACRAIFDGPNPISDDDMARAAAGPLEDRMDSLLDEMEPIRAVSAAGVLARADALAAHNRDFGYSFDCPEATTGRLLSCLLRDAAALAGRA